MPWYALVPDVTGEMRRIDADGTDGLSRILSCDRWSGASDEGTWMFPIWINQRRVQIEPGQTDALSPSG